MVGTVGMGSGEAFVDLVGDGGSGGSGLSESSDWAR